jgi:hypothetical protein
MDGIERLARKFAELHKQNRNPPSTAPRTGKVVGVNPLKIQWGEHIVLTEDQIIVPTIFKQGVEIPNRYMNTEGAMVEEKLVFKPELKKGDKVIIIPDESLQLWYLFDVC